jgi:hypothetical protein
MGEKREELRNNKGGKDMAAGWIEGRDSSFSHFR